MGGPAQPPDRITEDYSLHHETPSASDYLRLRIEAGLTPKTAEGAAAGLPATVHAVVDDEAAALSADAERPDKAEDVKRISADRIWSPIDDLRLLPPPDIEGAPGATDDGHHDCPKTDRLR